ncbi:MAG: Uma2 family endonuclease [Cyanobacteria bacterium J06559_3]
MTSLLLKDVTASLGLSTGDSEEHYTITAVSWQQYEALLECLSDTPGYRVTYLEGVLELVAPSRQRDRHKTLIGMLLEAYFQETRTRFYGLGSTTFRNPAGASGTEPDECYCLGTEKAFPDLAIEVVVANGNVDKLAVYQRLGVPEVWFWRQGQFAVHCLREGDYEQTESSELLPELNLSLLSSYVDHPEPLDAVLEFREKGRH